MQQASPSFCVGHAARHHWRGARMVQPARVEDRQTTGLGTGAAVKGRALLRMPPQGVRVRRLVPRLGAGPPWRRRGGCPSGARGAKSSCFGVAVRQAPGVPLATRGGGNSGGGCCLGGALVDAGIDGHVGPAADAQDAADQHLHAELCCGSQAGQLVSASTHGWWLARAGVWGIAWGRRVRGLWGVSCRCVACHHRPGLSDFAWRAVWQGQLGCLPSSPGSLLPSIWFCGLACGPALAEPWRASC